MIIYATKHIEGSVKVAIAAEANDTHLKLAPLAVLPDELCLEQRLILISQDTSRLLQDFTYANSTRSTPGSSPFVNVKPTVMSILESPLNVLDRRLLQVAFCKVASENQLAPRTHIWK